MNLRLAQTETFVAWLSGLRDVRAKARIIARLRSAELGNLGDARSIGDGVSEMRIHTGVGYRVHFTRRESVMIILLCGGDKSAQDSDIVRAKLMARSIG